MSKLLKQLLVAEVVLLGLALLMYLGTHNTTDYSILGAYLFFAVAYLLGLIIIALAIIYVVKQDTHFKGTRTKTLISIVLVSIAIICIYSITLLMIG